jgi:hypothetical protein
MNAGRELDALVADKVMGVPLTSGNVCIHDHMPHYSTDIAAAWVVVDKMAAKNWNWMLQPGYATFAMTKDSGGSAFGSSVQHAICLAALKAIGVTV